MLQRTSLAVCQNPRNERHARPATNALTALPLPPHLAQRGVAARIARVTCQAFPPVEAGVASGVPILLEVQAWMSGGRQGVSGGCGYHPGGRVPLRPH